jgi:hypothetical protein
MLVELLQHVANELYLALMLACRSTRRPGARLRSGRGGGANGALIVCGVTMFSHAVCTCASECGSQGFIMFAGDIGRHCLQSTNSTPDCQMQHRV